MNPCFYCYSDAEYEAENAICIRCARIQERRQVTNARALVKLIEVPSYDDGLDVMVLHLSRRIGKAAYDACNRIMAATR